MSLVREERRRKRAGRAEGRYDGLTRPRLSTSGAAQLVLGGRNETLVGLLLRLRELNARGIRRLSLPPKLRFGTFFPFLDESNCLRPAVYTMRLSGYSHVLSVLDRPYPCCTSVVALLLSLGRPHVSLLCLWGKPPCGRTHEDAGGEGF